MAGTQESQQPLSAHTQEGHLMLPYPSISVTALLGPLSPVAWPLTCRSSGPEPTGGQSSVLPSVKVQQGPKPPNHPSCMWTCPPPWPGPAVDPSGEGDDGICRRGGARAVGKPSFHHSLKILVFFQCHLFIHSFIEHRVFEPR